jgi:hypothetical protein
MMICVSVMLAVFLCWPLAFGGHSATALDSRAGANPVAVSAPAEPPEVIQAMAQADALQEGPKAESCYKRYQREVKTCNGGGSAACRLKNADNWDLCEATGFWPN